MATGPRTARRQRKNNPRPRDKRVVRSAQCSHSKELFMIFITLVASAFIWGFVKALKKHQASQSVVIVQRRNGWRN